ncbi:PAS domain S-box-containing protein [Sulfuritortus calidifontis]|uniref:Sensory/regulatory protein RpfC n=1 Tax=Sulfuritortus calidifontis TaxID=1914471 RepID=A0A4V2UQR5_9PROT|nr:ATP-binding protein [Sulfuritortus calidifontis]TCS72225.1 PAS domain S-box-containing protein [Sulfuritortus calidifontis]
MPKLSLSARVLWLTSLGLLLVTLAGLLFQVRSQVESERQAAEDNIRSVAAALLPVLRQTLVVGDIETVQQTLDSVGRYRGLARIVVYQAVPYQVIAQTRGKGADTVISAPAWFTGLLNEEIASYQSTITLGGITYAELLIEPSLAMVVENAWQVSRQALIASLVFLIGLVVLLGMMLRQGLKPLTGLAQTVKRFGDGELSERATVAGPPEIASTAAAFNQMAASIEELLAKVRVSEQTNRRLALVVEQSDDAILTLDLEGHVLSWNQGAERLYGYPAQEVMGRSVGFLLPDSRQGELAQWLDRVRHAIAGTRFESQLLTRDARLLDVSISASPLFDADGKRIGEINIGHDISERKAMARALHMAKDAAETANRAKSEFLANMSHEIRTPMNGILGMTELALDSELTEEQRDYLNIVKSSAEALLTVLNDILDFSKIEAGRLELEHITFELESVVSGAVRTLAIQAKDKGLALEWNIAADVPQFLVGDPARLRQILLNLLGNALKFTERGGVKVQVTVDQHLEHGVRLHLAVSDTGIGIPAEQLDSIFKAFSQVDASMTRRFGGTGLGLSICGRLAEMMGGRIWAESVLGQGSTFHFTVELAVAGAPPAPETETPERSAQAVAATCQVMLVEDVPVNQKLVQALLEKRGYGVTLAQDGEQALALLQQGRQFDLILMDLQMPGLDGYETTVRIREMERGSGRRTPIVAVTASALTTDRERCLALGMDAFMAKPFRADELYAAVERYCPQEG